MSIISHLKPNIEWSTEITSYVTPLLIAQLINDAMQSFTSASKGLDGGVVESVRLIKDDTESPLLRIRWRSGNRGLWKKLKRADDRFSKLPPLADYNAPYDEPLTGDEPFAPPEPLPNLSGLKHRQLLKLAKERGVDVSGISGAGASKKIIEKLIQKEQKNGED